MSKKVLDVEPLEKLSKEEALKLILELQVRQKELELQLRNTEDALIYSQAQFQQVFDTIHEGVVVINAEGKFSLGNNSALSMLGLTPDQLKGESVADPKWKMCREDGTPFPIEEQPGTVALRTGKDSTATLYLHHLSDVIRVLLIRATAFNLKTEPGKETTERNVLIRISDITERKKAEKDLQEQELFIRTITDNINGMIGYWTVDLLCAFANNDYKKWFGRTKKEMLGISMEEMMGKELFLNIEHHVRAALRGEHQQFERELTLPTGEKRFMFAQYIPHKVEDKVMGFIALVTDISDIKNTEMKYRLLYEANLMPMAIYEIETLNFLSVNNAFVETYGYSKEESINMSALKVVPDSEIEKTINLVKTQDSGIINAGTSIHKKKNGEIILVDLIRRDIIFDGKNARLVVANDVTQRNKALDELRKSEERFRILFDHAGVGVAQIETATGKFIKVNKKFAEIVGYSIDELLQLDFPSITYPADLAADFYHKDLLRKGDITEFVLEKRYIHKNGNIIWINLSVSAMWQKGEQPDFHIIVISDITQQKRAEQEILSLNNSLENKIALRTKELDLANQELVSQNEEIKRQAIELVIAKERAEESDRLKSAFLANMSHEIRTPMNGILGFAEILKKPNLSIEKQQQYISIIEKSGERMLSILNDIINISKIESGVMNVTISKTDINDQMEFIYSFFKQEAEKKGISFSLAKVLPINKSLISTDREKVYAVLTNLIKNAIKSTLSGSIEFGCSINPTKSATKELTDLEELIFFVTDTGKGIHRDKLDLIFERFRQADESRNSDGAGLGLTISKSYIEMLGGKIWAESEPGNGSTFYFTLPYHIEEEIKG